MNLFDGRVAKIAAAVALAVACRGWGQTQASGRMLYVDCSRAQGGDGSVDAPWNSLKDSNALTLRPGDALHLRRGTVCRGTLSPRGSGAEGRPIRITAYGEGSRPRVIAAPNAEESLRLFNQQYWDIDSLDLQGGTTYGIFISGDDRVLHHIHLSNLAVHDVIGGTMKHKESGLIAISPTSAKCHFEDVLVDGVNAWHTNQWVGILVGGGNLGFPPEEDWNVNAVIRNSTVHDLQGDGIVLFRVRKGLIDSSAAWSIGMQDTQTIGTPNAIWAWMCDECIVQRSEAYLTDSPGVDGGAFDIDYGNTKNSVLDSYGHDTQGYCVAIFGAGFVTRDSVVRGNLCINNGRSPRMAKYQGAIFLWTWNGGSLDGVTVEKNTVYWRPFEDSPALLNKAQIKNGTATFSENTIYSTAPKIAESNASLSLTGNTYAYYGAGTPDWIYGGKNFDTLTQLQDGAKQEAGGRFEQLPLSAASKVFVPSAMTAWTLDCVLPLTLDVDGLINDAALQQITILKSFSQQYAAQGLRVNVELTSSNPRLFETAAFGNALVDLEPGQIQVTHRTKAGPATTHVLLRRPDGTIASQWVQPVGPVALGLALRKVYGEPIYAELGVAAHE